MESIAPGAGPRWRARMYGLFARGFQAPPGPETVAALEECAGGSAGAAPAGWGDGLRALARMAAEAPEQDLLVDFNGLFMVPGARYTAPYESVYRDAPLEANGRAAARTFGPSTMQVMSFYERIGLAIAREYTELPDYAGMELACMEYLCLRDAEYGEAGSAESAGKARALQRAFLRDHLVKWIPALHEKVTEKAGTPYYRSFAELASRWIRREAEET